MLKVMEFGGFPTLGLSASVAVLKVRHLLPLYNARHYKEIGLMVSTLQEITELDLMTLTDDDFRYFLALVDRTSFTEDHRLVEWRCMSPVNGVPCNSLVTEDALFKVSVEPTRVLPTGYAYPRIATLATALDLIDEYGEDHVMACRWLDNGLSLAENVAFATLKEVMGAKSVAHTRVQVKSSHKCNWCPNQFESVRPLDIFTYLRVPTPKSVLNMQYNLNSLWGTQDYQNLEIATFFYHHGCYVKDKAEADAKRKLSEAQRRRYG